MSEVSECFKAMLHAPLYVGYLVDVTSFVLFVEGSAHEQLHCSVG